MPPTRTPAGPKLPGRTFKTTREALRLRGPTRRQLSRRQREDRIRRGIMYGGGSLLAIIVLVLGFGYWRENIVRAQETVAVIFGERVSTDDLLRQVRPRAAALDRQEAFLRENGLAQQALQLQFQRATLPELVLRDMIERRIVQRAAQERGITVTPEDIDARIRQLVAQVEARRNPEPTPVPTAAAGAQPSPSPVGPTPLPTPVPTLTESTFQAAYQEYLNLSGQTEAELRSTVEADLYEEKLREAIGAEVPAVQEQIHVRRMTFKTEAEAAAALERLRSGESFEALAAELSQDQATREQGGDLGWQVRDGDDPLFEEAAFRLQPGETSGVVNTASGPQIIQVIERDPARPLTPSQLDDARRRHYANWLAAAEGSAEIERMLTPEQSQWIMDRASGRRN